MIHWIVFIITGAAFFVSSYQQGLFYDDGIYTWHLGMAVVFTVYITYVFIRKNENTPSPLYFTIFLIPLCYLISFTNAITLQGAVDQFIQWTLFALFFVVLVTVKKNVPSVQQGILILVQLFGLYIALLPFLSSWGWLEYNDAILNGRFSSVFQYPNTYAAVTTAILLFNLVYLAIKRTTLPMILLLGLPLAVHASTLFLSLSRGAMILMPVIWFLGLCILHLSAQVKYILYTMLAFAGGFIVYMITAQEWGTFGAGAQVLTLIAISVLFTMSLPAINKGLDHQRIQNLSKKRFALVLPAAALTIGAVLVLDLVKQGMVYTRLPEQVQNRLQNMGYETIFEDGRFTFFFDAFRMLKDSPLVGWGGHGWSVLYHGYQTEPYVSNEVHSVLLEQLLNIGVIGFIIGAAVLLLMAVNSVLAYRKTASPMIPAGGAALFMLLGHGAIDFDFSFATICLLFMLLLALVVPEPPVWPLFKMERRTVVLGVSGLAAMMIVISSLYALRYEVAERKAQTAARETDNEEIFEKLTDARAWNPNKISYIENQAAVAVELQKEGLTLELSDQFTNVEPRSGYAWMQSGNSYASFGYLEEAMERYNQALDYDPFNTDIYQQIIRLTSGEAATLAQYGEQEQAEAAAARAAGAYERYDETTREFRENPEPGYKDLELSQASLFLTGQAYMIEASYQKGIDILNQIKKGEQDTYMRAQALIVHALEQQGKEDQAADRMTELNGQNAQAYYDAYQEIF